MKRLASYALVLAACATAPRAEVPEPVMLEGIEVEPIREAARAVVEEVASTESVVRVTTVGSVLTDGYMGRCGRDVVCEVVMGYSGTGWSRGTPWTTIEVRFNELESGTEVSVEIVYEDCGPRVDCAPQRLASTGVLERRILDGIRARLDPSESLTPSVPPVGCSPDTHGAADFLTDLLAEPSLTEWRHKVGLEGAEISQLSVVTNDQICQTLWGTQMARSPYSGFAATFFSLGDRYIMTEYPKQPPLRDGRDY